MKKKLLLDLYGVTYPYSGIGQFCNQFTRLLIEKLPKEIDLFLLIPSRSNANFGPSVHHIKSGFQKRHLPFLNKNYDLWHSICQLSPYIPNKNTPYLITIHDLNFLVEKKGYRKKRYFTKVQKKVYQADYLNTISFFTKKTVEENLDLTQKPISVIYNGVEIDTKENKKPTFIKTPNFFFSIGTFMEKKNFGTLVSMMQHMKNYDLVIAGRHNLPYSKKIKKQIQELGIGDRVILPGEITNGERNWLYKNCTAFLFTSWAEGFGIPPIEAMQFGKPVFLSKHCSLPEIGGEYAFYFDGFESKYMADFVEKKLQEVEKNKEDFSLCLKKYSQRFTWQSSIDQYIDLYLKILFKK